jgi:hypothetical protein
MCRLRHTNDPILSSLKMEGIRLHFFLSFCHNSPQWVMAFSFTRFLDHTQRRTTVDKTPLEKWSARRRNLHLTTHNTHKQTNFLAPVGFEPTISAGERQQTYDLDRAATGTGVTCASLPKLARTGLLLSILTSVHIRFLFVATSRISNAHSIYCLNPPLSWFCIVSFSGISLPHLETGDKCIICFDQYVVWLHISWRFMIYLFNCNWVATRWK